MRKEISEAIAIAHSLKNTQQLWHDRHTPAGEITPGNYSFMLSQAQQRNLQHVFSNIHSLRRCIETSALITTVQIGTTTSLEVYTDDPAHYAVVECSVYGMLVALFIYGVISSELIGHIQHCIAEQGLTLITNEERSALEEQSLYPELF